MTSSLRWTSLLVLCWAFATLAYLGGCAETHAEFFAQPVQTKQADFGPSIIISARENLELSSVYFGVLEITLENPTDQWLTIDRVLFDFEESKLNKNLSLTAGQDLKNWHEAASLKAAIEQQNQKGPFQFLALMGVGMSHLGGARSKEAGTMLKFGAATSLSIERFLKQATQAGQPQFSENHLLAGLLRIPPGLFVKRFVVINSKNHDQLPLATSCLLRLMVNGTKSQTYRLNFRDGQGEIRWQKDIQARQFNEPF